jgi:hypothetical protein
LRKLIEQRAAVAAGLLLKRSDDAVRALGGGHRLKGKAVDVLVSQFGFWVLGQRRLNARRGRWLDAVLLIRSRDVGVSIGLELIQLSRCVAEDRVLISAGAVGAAGDRLIVAEGLGVDVVQQQLVAG